MDAPSLGCRWSMVNIILSSPQIESSDIGRKWNGIRLLISSLHANLIRRSSLRRINRSCPHSTIFLELRHADLLASATFEEDQWLLSVSDMWGYARAKTIGWLDETKIAASHNPLSSPLGWKLNWRNPGTLQQITDLLSFRARFCDVDTPRFPEFYNLCILATMTHCVW